MVAVGDSVRLRSGGPLLTVVEVIDVAVDPRAPIRLKVLALSPEGTLTVIDNVPVSCVQVLARESSMDQVATLTKRQVEEMARAAGFDPQTLTWQQLLQMQLAILLQLFPPMQARAKAAGIAALEQLLAETARLSLEAACNSLQCCAALGSSTEERAPTP